MPCTNISCAGTKRLKKLFKQEYDPAQPLAWIGDINIAVEPIDVSNPESHKNDPCYHADAHNAFLDVCAFGFEDVFPETPSRRGVYIPSSITG